MLKAMAGYRPSISKVAAAAAVAVATLPVATVLGVGSASAATAPAPVPLRAAITAGVSSSLQNVAVAPGGKAWTVGAWYKGSDQHSLAAQWGGRSWRLQSSAKATSSPATDSLDDVAAISATSAWAVGFTDLGPTEQTLIERWNGTAWHRVPSPTPPGTGGGRLNGVATASPSSAWAVGIYINRCLALRWNGAAWKRVLVPSPAGAVSCQLNQVAILSPTSVWIVGDYYTGKADLTLIEHWNGKAWKRTATPNPAGQAQFNVLWAVTFASASNAWAVGSYKTSDSYLPLILRWNGSSWRQAHGPALGGAYTQTLLWAVAAQSARNAWAVGTFGSTTATQTVILHWNGSAWKRVSSPNPAGVAAINSLTGVASTRFGTWAVGSYTTTSGLYRTLVLRWTGKAWRIVASPNH